MVFGVYVHVPFCASRCDYCDFATWTDRAHLADAYVDACVTDVGRRITRGELPDATSVFFGGGTPSLLAADRLVRILDAIPRADGAEITVECNPDSVDREKLDAFRSAGVDRVSVGVQSMRPHVLRALGRTHDPDNVVRAIGAARDAGFERVSVDLIYGAASESFDDWRATLLDALALGPDHVSAYALTVEPGTPLGRMVAAGERRAPDDDDQADKYLLADELLTAAGFDWYEISNWARPGQECRHNWLYWDGGDYAGIGCAAHGHTGGRRWWNVRTPDRYVDLVARDAPVEAGAETLDPATRAEEAFALALRTRTGARVPAGGLVRDRIDVLAEDGLVVADGDRIRLTTRGRLLASAVTVDLLAAGATRDPGDPAPRRLALGTIEC
jgi:oxygen-independent coproporphyrinogen-3 oxidase